MTSSRELIPERMSLRLAGIRRSISGETSSVVYESWRVEAGM